MHAPTILNVIADKQRSTESELWCDVVGHGI